MTTVLSILVLVASVVLIVSILMQDVKEGGLGAIGGGVQDSFWGSNRGSSKEAILRKVSTISAIVFMVSLVVLAAV